MVLLQQMSVLFLLMMAGFICRKKGLLDDESSKKLSGLVVNVANPALVLTAGINQENSIQGKELIFGFALALCIFASMMLLGIVIPKLIHAKKENYGVYRVMLVFSNIGFMGFPVIRALYGEEALLRASLFMVPYNVLIYTYGISSMSAGKITEDGQKNEAASKKEGFPWKKIFNIGVIACFISMILYLTKIEVPSVLEEACDYLASLTAPLSMIVIGDSMTKMNVKELVTNIRLLVFSVIKLLILPIIGGLILRAAGVSLLMQGVCMVMLSTPVGSMTAMLAQQYGGDYELTSRGVALTTLLSVVTMPVVALVLGL